MIDLCDASASVRRLARREARLMPGRVTWTASAIALTALCLAAPVRAQPVEDIPCDAFARNADSSWTATKAAFILGPNFSVRLGAVFRPGEPVRGYDLVGKLEQECRNYVPPAAPAGAPPAAEQSSAQQSLVPLSRYADANGNLEVSRLACGHLADASTQDAEMLLTWYAGSLAATKKRVLNLAHLRTAMRGVIDYCRANRERSLVRTMDQMLR
jgi:hypothetical protein